MLVRNKQISKERLDELNKQVISEFILPLKIETKNNIKKLFEKNNGVKEESLFLFSQAFTSLNNAMLLLSVDQLVDASVLIRSSYENIMMAIVIYFDTEIYNEFKNSENKKYTKVYNIRKKFINILHSISNDFFDNKELIYNIYKNLCNYVHSTLYVIVMNKAIKNKDEDIFKAFIKLNIYIMDILLNNCLKYFIGDSNKSIYTIGFISLYSLLIYEVPEEKLNKKYLSKYSEIVGEKNIENLILNFNKLKSDLEEFVKTHNFCFNNILKHALNI